MPWWWHQQSLHVCWRQSVSSGPDFALVIALTKLSNEAVDFRL